MSDNPLDDLTAVIESIPHWPAADRLALVQKFMDGLPAGQGGDKFADIYAWLSLVQGNEALKTEEIHLSLLASTYRHGPKPEIVRSWSDALSKGRAPLNRLCIRDGLGMRILDMAIDMPDRVGDLARLENPAGLMANVAFGMEATASGGSFIGVSDLAPGSRQSALAILCALQNQSPVDISSFLMPGESGAIEEMMSIMPSGKNGPLDWLALLGGREIAALAGAILAASSQNLPVLLEGWSALAAATVLVQLAPDGNAQNILGHCMVASTATAIETSFWHAIDLEPLLQNIGEMPSGTGLVLASGVVRQMEALAGGMN